MKLRFLFYNHEPCLIDMEAHHAEGVRYMSRGSWALLHPDTQTLQADSRAVTCCPEYGRLKFERSVVVCKEQKLTAISIYKWFNNH